MGLAENLLNPEVEEVCRIDWSEHYSSICPLANANDFNNILSKLNTL